MPFAPRGSRLTLVAASVALLTAIAMPVLPLMHAVGQGDSCSPTATEHDASAHHIGARVTPTEAPHCPLCHLWQSAGRFKGSSLHSTLIPFVDIGRVVTTLIAEPGLVVNSSQPARAPPAS